MPELDAHKKPLLETTPDEVVTNPQVKFDDARFTNALQDKGQEIYIEKAMRCPCLEKATGAAMTNCKNCGGSSWFFVSKKKTIAVVQSINRKTTFSNWSEEDRGTVNVTFRPVDRIAFMDRITLTRSTSTYSEVVKMTKYGLKTFAYTVYLPLLITDAYLFDGVGNPLKSIELLADFTIEDNKIVLSSEHSSSGGELSVSLRYTHYPQYHVLDIPREVSVSKDKNCTDEEYLKSFPFNAICRKSHYVMEAPNAMGESLFDNTNYTNSTVNDLLESLPSTSLLYQIVRSSAQQIADALHEEGDTNKINTLVTLLP